MIGRSGRVLRANGPAAGRELISTLVPTEDVSSPILSSEVAQFPRWIESMGRKGSLVGRSGFRRDFDGGYVKAAEALRVVRPRL